METDEIDVMKEVCRINAALKSVHPNPMRFRKMEPDESLEPGAGQVWRAKTENEDFPPILLLEELDNCDTYKAAPLFRWTEQTGPDDLLVPEYFFGVEMTISFELKFSISKNLLASPLGELPTSEAAYLIKAEAESGEENKSDEFQWGWPYLDECDNRHLYHTELMNEIEKLRRSTFKNLNQSHFLILFPSHDATFDMAAASGKKNEAMEYFAKDFDAIVRFCKVDGGDLCVVEVFEKESGVPSDSLNKCELKNRTGETLAVFDGGGVELEKIALANGIRIVSPNGDDVELEPVSDSLTGE